MTDLDIKEATLRIDQKARERLAEKGRCAFVSSHEILGVITEEYHELIDAIEKTDEKKIYDEILDIAVAAHIALASLATGGHDWL